MGGVVKHNVTDFHHVRTLPEKKRCPARKNTNGPRVATHMQRTIEPSFRIKSLWWIAFLQGLCSQRERLATVGVGGSLIMKINSGAINLWPKGSRHLILLSLPTPPERSARKARTPGSDGHRAFEYTVY